MDFLSDLFNLPNAFLQIVPNYPPYSSIFVIFASVAVSLLSTLITRRMIDVDKLARYSREAKEFQSLRMKAMRSQDRKLLKKVEDNEDRAKKIQSELMTMRLRPLLYTFLPIIIVFTLMNGYFGARDAIVAIIPFNLWDSLIIIPIQHDILKYPWHGYFVPSYIGWYFFASIVFGAAIQKIAGLSPD